MSRLYTFINCYLSSIQQGIQSGHILGEICLKDKQGYLSNQNSQVLRDFLAEHKTFIVCNGGNHSSIKNLYNFFNSPHNPYPWNYFKEDSESLDDILTGVGIILPEEVYDVECEVIIDKKTGERIKKFVFNGDGVTVEYTDPSTYTYQLIDLIKSAPLAR